MDSYQKLLQQRRDQEKREEYEPFDIDPNEGYFDDEGEFHENKDQELPYKRRRMTKEEHLYGSFYEVTTQGSPSPNLFAQLNKCYLQVDDYWEKRDYSRGKFDQGFSKFTEGDSDQERKGLGSGLAFVKSSAKESKEQPPSEKIKVKLGKRKKEVRFAEKVQVKEINQELAHSEQDEEILMEPTNINPTMESGSQLPVNFGKQGSAESQKLRNVRIMEEKKERQEQRDTKKLEQEYGQKYGKGFKLLQMAGNFQAGKGVGKDLQGMLKPIEVQARKDNTCLGVQQIQPVKKQKKEESQDPKVKMDAEDKEFMKMLQKSRDRGKQYKKTTQEQLKIDDAFNTSATLPLAGKPPLKIIDMRFNEDGEQLNDLYRINTKKELNPPTEQDQQIQINTGSSEGDSLLKRKENLKHSLQTIIHKKQYYESQRIQLEYEQTNLKKQLIEEQVSYEMMKNFKIEATQLKEKIRKSLDLYKKGDAQEELSLFKKCFDLWEKYPEYYGEFNMNLLAVQEILDQISKKLQKWVVREQMFMCYDVFLEVRNILTIGKQQRGSEEVNLFSDIFEAFSNDTSTLQNADVMYYIFNQHWLHPVRTFITTQWEVKTQCYQFIDFFNKWNLLMPEAFLQKVIEMYLKPRLRKEIEDNWNPREQDERNLAENWLLPWKDFLGEKEMQSFFIQVKLKLTPVLSDWKPKDPLAKVLLKPWKDHLDKRSFENILVRSIVPKLQLELKGMEIDPSDQDIKPLLNLFEWQGLLEDSQIVSLLKDNVMPKWLQTLSDWFDIIEKEMQGEEEKIEAYEEVLQNYQGWKQLIPKGLREDSQLEGVLKLGIWLIKERIN